MSVRIITDSTADIRPALAEQIPFVSLMIRFGDREYTDGVTMSRKEFYEHLQVCKAENHNRQSLFGPRLSGEKHQRLC